MRWDRKFRRWLLIAIAGLGVPLFWAVYGLWWWVEYFIRLVIGTIKTIRWKARVWRVAVSHLKKKKKTPRLGRLRMTAAGLIVVLLGSGFSFWWWIVRDLPKPHQLLTREQPLTTKIYDRHGILLYKFYKNQNRSIVPLSSLPNHVIGATLAIEDAEFYNHPGFSLRGISRALRSNLESSSLQGGSTITQQLVKNALLTSERTLLRKIKEFVLALEVEYYFTKDEILSMYLNEVGYGGTIYGIEEAANYYFDKSARDLSLAEAALIAGLPASPTTYSPFGLRPDLAVYRQHLVLKRMAEEKMISWEEVDQAQAEPLAFALPTNDILAPHFVMYVKEWLVNRYGETMVNSGGLEVVTTLDYRAQQMTQEAIELELEKLKGMRVSNGAALITIPKSGEIIAMVGSKSYFDTAVDGQVNVTLRPRQPGSSIKPLTYALALEQGIIKPSTLIDDSPITYQVLGSPAYSPRNYDGRFHGQVTARQALANSYNVPAVKVLAQVGVPQLVAFAKRMGITTWEDSSRYGLSLTLGGGEVTMKDMAEAYGVFATGGYHVPLTSVLRVSNYRGEQLYEFNCSSCMKHKVLSTESAFIISDILADNRARSAAFGTNSVLNIPGKRVAVKTGTTNDLRDNWTFGYTSDYLVGSWVGNNNNESMSRVVSGITGASPIWHTVMKTLLEDSFDGEFALPQGMIKVQICATTQTLPCTGCPLIVEEYFASGTEPTVACREDEFEPSPAPEEESLKQRDRLLEGIIDQRRKRRD
jgi:1A family penicillin-binding protein